MAVVATGKPSRTHVEVVSRFGAATLVRCRLETGRTHQIRVHALAGLGHALVGDPVYGDGAGAQRTLLHAQRLEVPRDGKPPWLVAVIAVPASSAQRVVDLVVAAGIKAVLNFSPGALQVPEDVKMKSVDLTVSLESLSFFLARAEAGGPDGAESRAHG